MKIEYLLLHCDMEHYNTTGYAAVKVGMNKLTGDKKVCSVEHKTNRQLLL